MRTRNPAPTDRQLELNLIATIRALPPGTIERGHEWWPEATEDVAYLAAKYAEWLHRCVYAAACLSPGIPWRGTLETLEMLLAANLAGEDMPRGQGHLTFGYRGRERAWSIITEGKTELCRGPKVEAVAEALFGHADAVPVDRHMVRAATKSDRVQVSPAQSARIASATRRIASALGHEARGLQAAIWLGGVTR